MKSVDVLQVGGGWSWRNYRKRSVSMRLFSVCRAANQFVACQSPGSNHAVEDCASGHGTHGQRAGEVRADERIVIGRENCGPHSRSDITASHTASLTLPGEDPCKNEMQPPL